MRQTIVLLAVAAICQAHPAMGHMGTRIYPIYELPTDDLPDLHDSSIAEWEHLVPAASLNPLDFEYLFLPGVGIMTPDDLTARVFLGWNGDTQRLYFAVERVDDSYINEFDGTGPYGPVSGVWNQDSVEFYVDGDHSGGEYGTFWDCFDDDATEECFEVSQQQAQSYELIAQSPDDRFIYIINNRKDWASLPPWADAGGFQYGEAPNYSFVEGYVTPWDELNIEGPEQSRTSELAAGRIIGFQVVMPDYDVKPSSLEGAFAVAAGTGQIWHQAEQFVDGQLLPCPGGDCSQARVSAVLPDSWARIKAGFR